jgi:NTE family protein
MSPTAGLASDAVAESEPQENTDRPRIILALGGGGAKGAAHIGVLRVLEELQVPIDGIVGTSIGSIVGGLYASGLTLDEIESTLLTIDWNDAFRDSTARDLLSFRRKEDETRLKVKARVGIKNGRPVLPLGLIQGQKLELILRRLTLRVASIRDFDRLPIPYRAVTTDLETGEPVVLGSGDLVTAIRASMSIPAVFEPVEVDDRLLIDGGLVSNLPVREARAMGADVVIAVDVGSRPLRLEDITDPIAAATQAINLLMTRETERQIATLGPSDILLQPDLDDVDIASFLDSGMIIPRGEAVARAAADDLNRLAVSAEEFAELRQQQSSRPFSPPLVTEIRVTENAEIATGYISSRLKTKVGQRLDIDTLYTDLERVYGLGVWKSVSFDLIPDGEPTENEPVSAILEIDAREKVWGTSFARLGFDLATDSAIRRCRSTSSEESGGLICRSES